MPCVEICTVHITMRTWMGMGTYDERPDAPVDEVRAAHFGEDQPGVGGWRLRRYEFVARVIDDDEYLDVDCY